MEKSQLEAMTTEELLALRAALIRRRQNIQDAKRNIFVAMGMAAIGVMGILTGLQENDSRIPWAFALCFSGWGLSIATSMGLMIEVFKNQNDMGHER